MSCLSDSYSEGGGASACQRHGVFFFFLICFSIAGLVSLFVSLTEGGVALLSFSRSEGGVASLFISFCEGDMVCEKRRRGLFVC